MKVSYVIPCYSAGGLRSQALPRVEHARDLAGGDVDVLVEEARALVAVGKVHVLWEKRGLASVIRSRDLLIPTHATVPAPQENNNNNNKMMMMMTMKRQRRRVSVFSCFVSFELVI